MVTTRPSGLKRPARGAESGAAGVTEALQRREPGFRMDGTVTLREPAAFGRAEGVAQQYDLMTERHMVFTISIPDRRATSALSPGRRVTVEVLVRGRAILDGFPGVRARRSPGSPIRRCRPDTQRSCPFIRGWPPWNRYQIR